MIQQNNFMDESEEAKGISTDRDFTKMQASSPEKYRQADVEQNITYQHASRPSNEFKTKSGIKASMAFETSGTQQVVSTYEE